MLFGTRDPDPGRDVATWTHTTHSLSHEPELKSESQHVIREDVDEVIGCTQPNCTCECFRPGRVNLRSCDRCKHGWVAHAVSKLSAGAVQCSGQVEIVQCSVVFDISTLLLYGTQALPVRMKILLDRLFSVLTHTQVITILHTLGWTLRDYIRGYILQDSMGKVLDRWVIMTPEDEVVTQQQFLRFGETKSIVELMAVQEHQDRLATNSKTTKSDSDIRLFIESSSHHLGLQRDTAGDQTPPSLHHFENLPGGNLAFLQPFQYQSQSTSSPLISSSAILQEVSAVACRLQQTGQGHGTDSIEPLRGSKTAMTATSDADEKINRGLQLDCKLDNSVSLLGKPSNKLPSITVTDPRAVFVKGERPGSFSCSSSSVRDRGLGLMVRKGRVSCSACGKTFYDKGTLKIHYNAVHLKIKHRCTIEGCNMVFSSLRSRNRHSANPNPRLHTPALRNTHSPQHQLPSAQPCAAVLPSRIKPPPDVAPPCIPSLSSSILETSHTPLMFPSMKAVQPVPPFYSTMLSSRRSSILNCSGDAKTNNRTSVIDQTLKQKHMSICEGNNTAVVQRSGNPNKLLSMVHTVPKKKPRKSSMPVKIKREMFNEQDHQKYLDNGNNGDDDNYYHSDDSDEGSMIDAYHINGQMTTQQSSQTSIQPSSEFNINKFHINSHNDYIFRGSRMPTHAGDNHEVSVMDNNKVCKNTIQKTHRTSSCFNIVNMKEKAASEKTKGVMKKRMRSEGQSGREEIGEPLLKVKEEVYDPSYDLHCSRHCDFNNWENRGVVAVTSAVISDQRKDFNSSSDQEEEEERPDEE
ncbi:zinc finger protein basonuclin-2 [Astyanax mexicanus]|uniref:zinc finger protein basonuclin-2 n=1 Tax=Astyanax mexicanus TaxID=7994 RepID=UPI0020CB433B|nr:zinc finger protein basonuclin-2 [Astyanax mexicanus]XP_049319059.1 zinc finger protein basonuclin-2 [Astyanax mexicanus]